jgi:hypothetical protein
VSQGHLIDNQLQDYLDGNIAETDPVALHLNDCPRCQRALAAYRNLFSAIEKVPAPELSPDFAEAVMNRLPVPQPVIEPAVTSRFRLRDSMVMFIAMAAVVATALYFLSPDLLMKPFSGLSAPSSVPDTKILDDVNGWLSTFNFNSLMIVFVLLTFAGIGVVDRLISRRRQHHKPVSFLV